MPIRSATKVFCLISVIIVSNANGEVETSSDKKGKANDVGDAQKGKSDAPSTENSAPGKRSDILGADEFYPVFERSRRDLRPHFAYLRNIRNVRARSVALKCIGSDLYSLEFFAKHYFSQSINQKSTI